MAWHRTKAGAAPPPVAEDRRRSFAATLLAAIACGLSAGSALTNGLHSPLPALGVAAGLAAVLAARAHSSRLARSEAASAAAQRERRRLARDLHDGVAQTLTHLRMELDMLAHPQFTASLEPAEIARLARVAERTLGEVRGLIRDMSAPLRAGGLAEALASYVEDLRTTHGPRVVFAAGGSPAASAEVEGALFRIAQEAISNAVRHAGAGEVRVLLSGAAGSIALCVQDDGCGIPAVRPVPRRDGGYGLIAMQERAAAAGLALSVQPAPGGGTRVTAATPAGLSRSA